MDLRAEADEDCLRHETVRSNVAAESALSRELQAWASLASPLTASGNCTKPLEPQALTL